MKKIAILGFGVTGQAAARYFLKKESYFVDIFDNKSRDDINQEQLDPFLNNPQINFFFNYDNVPQIDSYDQLIVSPGVSLEHPIVELARGKGVPVFNDVSIFIPEWRKIGPVVGVTGTNGKSTVVSLLYEILQGINQPSILVGNIGRSPLDFLDVNHPQGSVAVMELSSYQLELFDSETYADIAIITNLTEDHLDRHKTMESYANAKMKILNPEKTEIIVSGEDTGINKYILPKIAKTKIHPILLSELNSEIDSVIDQDNRMLKGDHNLMNIALVVQVLKLLHIPISKQVLDIIKKYRGLEHRIEFVKEISGVTYINDSKSTTPDSTKIALEAFGDFQNIILIAGGFDKGVNFSSLKDYLNKFVKYLVILNGEVNDKLIYLAESIGLDFIVTQNMQEAVEVAAKMANKNETVLLSPATSSFGMFKNFEERGQIFKAEVAKLDTN